MSFYAVKIWGGRTYKVEAENSTKAKKIVCKMLGRAISAPLIGARGMTARKVKA